MDSICHLRDIFSAHRFRPLKRLGQNFLIDANVAKRIVEALSPGHDDAVIEIGPGLGALTFEIARRSGAVIAVEKDRALCGILGERLEGVAPGVKLICGDILRTDLSLLAGGRKVKVIGNLPYSATTPILEYLIGHRRFVSRAVLTVQREFALRLLARPGGKEYGSISCFVQYHAAASAIRSISRTCFYPRPEVDSSVIMLEMRASPPVDVRDEGIFFTVIRKAFNQRRKTLLNSLSSKGISLLAPRSVIAEALARSGVEARSRAEELGLKGFADIANNITQLQKNSV